MPRTNTSSVVSIRCARSLPLRLSHDFLLLYDAQIDDFRGRLKEFQKTWHVFACAVELDKNPHFFLGKATTIGIYKFRELKDYPETWGRFLCWQLIFQTVKIHLQNVLPGYTLLSTSLASEFSFQIGTTVFLCQSFGEFDSGPRHHLWMGWNTPISRVVTPRKAYLFSAIYRGYIPIYNG